MIIKMVSPEVVSMEPYVKTDIANIFINAETGKVCIIERDAAHEIILENFNNGKECCGECNRSR